jgi:hypothetical protein
VGSNPTLSAILQSIEKCSLPLDAFKCGQMAFRVDQGAESAQAIGPGRALRNGYGGGEGARLGDLRNGDNVLPGIAAA